MNISINKDIEKYQESVVMGLTARQLIFSIASIACGGAIVLLTYRHVGLTGSAYIAIPVVAPLALNGFYSYQGMSFPAACPTPCRGTSSSMNSMAMIMMVRVS